MEQRIARHESLTSRATDSRMKPLFCFLSGAILLIFWAVLGIGPYFANTAYWRNYQPGDAAQPIYGLPGLSEFYYGWDIIGGWNMTFALAMLLIFLGCVNRFRHWGAQLALVLLFTLVVTVGMAWSSFCSNAIMRVLE